MGLLAAALPAAAVTTTGVEVVGDVQVLDPTGMQVLAPQPVTGVLDEAAGTLTLEPVLFFGMPITPHPFELLGEGSHTRNDPATGTPLTTTVGPGQLGAFMVVEWGLNTFSSFIVWDVVPHAGGRAFQPADSDGDGIPGQAFVTGPFPGFTLLYSLREGSPPPEAKVSVTVAGGAFLECDEPGGHTVTATADVTLVGGAQLSEVQWTVDGNPAGTGTTLSIFLPLGQHTLEATAVPVTGVSNTAAVPVNVIDTKPPEVSAAFVDHRTGAVVTEAARGKVEVRYAVADACDPNPAVDATVVPVFAVADGQVLKIQGEHQQVRLPTTALHLTVTGTDATGNSATAEAVLHVLPGGED
ncbi:MAG: hypothetical protein D6739_11910 [Nitrospirae bacterium]|nr:MAG: hypothetical protein D6739_11910 [Nitrospirota bacterium]